MLFETCNAEGFGFHRTHFRNRFALIDRHELVRGVSATGRGVGDFLKLYLHEKYKSETKLVYKLLTFYHLRWAP